MLIPPILSQFISRLLTFHQSYSPRNPPYPRHPSPPLESPYGRHAASQHGSGPNPSSYGSTSYGSQPAANATYGPVSPLSSSHICLFPNCGYTTARAYDLKRHAHFHAPSQTYPCSYSWCPRGDEKPFTRRDHLDEHLRTVHMKTIPKKSKKGGKQNQNAGAVWEIKRTG